MKCLGISAAAFVGLALADSSGETLRGKIVQSLESFLALEVKGIENCENKCDKAFNRFAYQVNTIGTQSFEFQACVIGCNQCSQDLNSSTTDNSNCFDTCKTTDWVSMGIFKGVIEPDKACIGGCIIQTCQVICAGGTVLPPSKGNPADFFPNGGCSIKTEPYSQNQNYVPWDSPNSGQGGSSTIAQCCSNSLSLCQYVGNKASTNFQQLLTVTTRFCNEFVSPATEETICAYFENPRNCGTVKP